MALKAYEVPNGNGGTTTLLLSDEDAKARGLTGGKARATSSAPDPAVVKSKVRTAANK